MSGITAVMAQLPTVLAAQGGYVERESTGPIWPMLVFFAVYALSLLGAYGFGIWALVDTIRHRDDEFEAVGSNRGLWLVLLLVGLVVCQPVALVAGLIFVVKVRPRVRAWRQDHPPPPPGYVAYVPVPYIPPPGTYPPPGSYAPPPPPPQGPPPPPPAPPAGPPEPSR